MINIYAGVAEQADAWDLKSHGGDLVRVQFPSPVPLYKICGATKLADILLINEAAHVADSPSRERENRRSCG